MAVPPYQSIALRPHYLLHFVERCRGRDRNGSLAEKIVARLRHTVSISFFNPPGQAEEAKQTRP